MRRRFACILIFASLILDQGSVFSTPFYNPVQLAKGSGIVFVTQGHFFAIFERDSDGAFHILRYDLQNLEAPPLDFIMESFPEALAMDSSGRYIAWFTPFGGIFATLDFQTGLQKVIMTRKAGQPAFWMDPPYRLVFDDSSHLFFYGYSVDKKGTVNQEGIFKINLAEEGMESTELVVSKKELQNLALPIQGKLLNVSLLPNKAIFYHLRNKHGVHWFRYNVAQRKARELENFQGPLGGFCSSDDGQWTAFEKISRTKPLEIFLQSLKTGEKILALSGTFHLMAVSNKGNAILVAQLDRKKKLVHLGIAEKQTGFKFEKLFDTSHPMEVKGAFTQGGKAVIFSTHEGLWWQALQ